MQKRILIPFILLQQLLHLCKDLQQKFMIFGIVETTDMTDHHRGGKAQFGAQIFSDLLLIDKILYVHRIRDHANPFVLQAVFSIHGTRRLLRAGKSIIGKGAFSQRSAQQAGDDSL